MTTSPTDASEEIQLVLASGSPRRQQLLDRLGLRFAVRPVDIDESPQPEETARGYVMRLATAKARAAARAGELVLGADTVVTLDGALLGKPQDDDDARRMLTLLAGREHEVMTGVAICDLDRALRLTICETTRVRFAALQSQEIDWYLASGEPRDKAGAYAIQGQGALFVEEIDGSYSNVVGLPLPATYRLLRRAGYDPLGIGPVEEEEEEQEEVNPQT